jgi:hypothetical protein
MYNFLYLITESKDYRLALTLFVKIILLRKYVSSLSFRKKLSDEQ